MYRARVSRAAGEWRYEVLDPSGAVLFESLSRPGRTWVEALTVVNACVR